MKEITATKFRRDIEYSIRELPVMVMRNGEPWFIVSDPYEKAVLDVAGNVEGIRCGGIRPQPERHELTDICPKHGKTYLECGCSLYGD